MNCIRTTYIQALAAILLLFAAGCYKDKGNYTYTDVNKISISIDTFPLGGIITVNQGDTLKMVPTITQTIGKDESQLAYEWKIFDNTPSSDYSLPQTVLATTRNLSTVITAPNFTLGQQYRLTYKVTDQNTGISFIFVCNIAVSNRFAKGWMLLEDLPNGGDFSMLLAGGVVVHNVFAQFNPSVPMGNGKPARLDVSTLSIDDGITKASKKIYIYNENSALELDFQTLKKKFDLGNLFFIPPAVMKPARVAWFSPASSPSQATFGTAVNDQKMYISEIGGYPGAKKFGSPLLTPNGDNDYSATPFIASAVDYPIMYDSRHRRFYIVRNTKLDNFPASASSVVDMNNLNMDLLSLDDANMSRGYNAIVKDGTGTINLLRLQFTANIPLVTSFIQPMNAPGIGSMTAVLSSNFTPHIFYAVGNVLYRYETTSNTTIQLFSFPAGETVNRLKFGFNAELLAATWNGTESKVYLFNINNTGAITNNTYTAVYGGFAKIIDAFYKF